MTTASLPVLGGVTLPSPTEQQWERFYRGGVLQMANGAIVHDLVDNTARHLFHLSWKVVTDAQLTTIAGAWDGIKNANATYVSIRGTSHTVTQPDNAQLRFTPVVTAGGDIKYNVELELEETV